MITKFFPNRLFFFGVTRAIRLFGYFVFFYYLILYFFFICETITENSELPLATIQTSFYLFFFLKGGIGWTAGEKKIII
jgi:hypothetical protein